MTLKRHFLQKNAVPAANPEETTGLAANPEKAKNLAADLEAALAKDPFLSGFGRSTLQIQLQLLTANQTAAGFTMCEIAAGNGGLTKQV